MKDELHKITLRQLQIFLVASKNLSFLRTAELLDLTPPAISMQMSKLTESVGIPLFEKQGRQLVLTEGAKTLIPHAENIMSSLDKATEQIEILRGIHSGSIKIAMVTTSRNFGPKMIARFQELHPDITIDISIANRKKVTEMLENKEIDIALMGRPPARIPVEAVSFSDHPYVAIADPEHPLTKQKDIQPDALIEYDFLVREKGSGTRMVFEHFFREKSLKFPTTREMNSNENIKQAVMAGMGVAFISKHTINLELNNKLLNILDIETMPEIRMWYAVHLNGHQLSPAAELFKDFVLNEGPTFMKQFFSNSPIAENI